MKILGVVSDILRLVANEFDPNSDERWARKIKNSTDLEMQRIEMAAREYRQRLERGEVKLTEEEPAGQTQKPKQLRLSDLDIPDLEPYIG